MVCILSIVACKVERPAILNKFHNEENRLVALQGVVLTPMDTANTIMNKFGAAFRSWCRANKKEIPPTTWNLHLLGRGDNDNKSAYPTLDSNVKASHTKIILFFVGELTQEICQRCRCTPASALCFCSYRFFWGVDDILSVRNVYILRGQPRHKMLASSQSSMGALPVFVCDRSPSPSFGG